MRYASLPLFFSRLMRNEQKDSRKKSSCIVITYQTFWCVVYLSIFTAQLVKILSDTKTKTTNKIYVCMSGEEVLAKPFLSLINKKQPHHLTFFERICQLASIVFKVCVYRIWCFCKNFCPFLSWFLVISVLYQYHYMCSSLFCHYFDSDWVWLNTSPSPLFKWDSAV